LLLNLETAVQLGDMETARKIEKEIPKRRREYSHVNNEFRNMKPTYFNTGCCCYNDGNITGIEIADNNIRLVKWEMEGNVSKRIVAEEIPIADLIIKL
jgi:hypothetical protein